MNIPVLRSLLSQYALRPLLEKTYNIKIVRLQLIKAVISDTYRVVIGNGQYILRIYPGRRRTLSEMDVW